MLDLSERALLVFQNDDLVGVVSEIDVVRKCVAERLNPATTEVAHIMSRDLKTINSKDSLAEAIEIMQKEGFHHLPVVNGEKILGLISNDDIPEEYRMLLEHFKDIKNA